MSHKVHLSKSVFDKALTTEAKKNYSLSIQFSLDGFSFCVLDDSRNKYSGLEIYDFQDVNSSVSLEEIITRLLTDSIWLSNDYQSISIVYESPQMSLIPEPLFQDGRASEYLRFNHILNADDEVCHDRLPNLEAVNIFAVPENLIKLFDRFFPGVKVHHFASPLIENLLIRNKNYDKGEMIFVKIRKHWLDIIVLDGRKLLFFNSFQYKTKEDFAYYLVYVIEQLGMNPEKVELVLMGEILKISDIYTIILKYVRNVSFIKRSIENQYSYIFDDIPEHFHYNLLNLQPCEL